MGKASINYRLNPINWNVSCVIFVVRFCKSPIVAHYRNVQAQRYPAAALGVMDACSAVL
jgi:hypothetical protein